MTQHSSLVGGSTADRLINCHGSYQATAALPPSADVPSEYAAEGSAMHEVMAAIMRARILDFALDLYKYAATLIGSTFLDRVLTQAHVDEMISPALEALAELEAAYGDGFRVVGVETSVRFPGIPGAFGTADLTLRSTEWALMVDWKFGGGVAVEATYNAGTKHETLNPQLAFYLTAALNTTPKGFSRRRLAVAIVQPRAELHLTHTEVSRWELRMFREDLENAVVEALKPNPERTRGDWCRFAPCKINCPHWVGALLDLSFLEPEKKVEPVVEITNYAQYLAKAKRLVDAVVLIKKSIDEQLHAYLEAGGTVPGWKLKLKSKNRQWIEDKVVERKLKKLGFKKEDIFVQKLLTFTAADAIARQLGVVIPEELRVAPVSTETTIVPDGDPAPPVNRRIIEGEFAEALKKLT